MDFTAGMITNQPIVIDNGTGVIKAGFSGEDLPKYVAPSYVGRPKHVKIMAGALDGDHFVGRRAQEYRGLMKLHYPMNNGIVNDWGDMERVWKNIYLKELQANSEEHPVLLTEAPLNPLKNRAKAAEVFFETFNVPALYISMQPVLSLYSSGRTTGLVLDCGDGVSHAVPVYEGFALPHSIQRIDLAGRDITNHLQLLLRRAGYAFNTTAEWEIVKSIKEKLCFISTNTRQEEMVESNNSFPQEQFVLPDRSVIEVKAERFRAPEILFNPHLVGEECVGVHQMVTNAIARSDVDLRSALYSNIVLAGGSTFFRGFGERLLSEVKNLAPRDMKIRISAPPERRYSTWIGGSILASLATFKKMWVSAKEYHEEGERLVHRRTF